MMEIFDYVIVGSGVAGMLIADKLSKNGAKVVVVEAGPENNDRESLMDNYFSAKLKTPQSAYPDHPEAPRPKSEDPNHYYVQKGPDFYKSPFSRKPLYCRFFSFCNRRFL